MSWVFSDGKEVAEIDSCRLHAGEATLGAFQVVLAVRCVAYQSQDKTPWKVWPSGARVWLFKNPEQRVFWGYFLSAGNWVAPPLHDGKPHKQEMAFAREFTASEIAALEEWRSGEDATLKVIVYGSGVKGAEMISHSYFREHDERVPRSRWSDLLRDLRFRETLHIQVPVGIDSRGDQAGVYLREAMSHRERGDYSAVALSCRKAIEALGQAGFGRKGPKEIEKFLRDKGEERDYTLEERTAVMLTAARLLCHSGAHAGEEEKRWCRSDADLAVAVTAGLVKVAPNRLQNVEEVPADVLP